METKKLDFGKTLQESISIGVKNAPSIIAAVALWIVTIWIPYLNVGTTIAIAALPTELAKGNVINPLGIFDSKYRRRMGEYLLTVILMVLGIYAAMIFLFVPGIVLAIAWSLAVYFLVDKGKSPMQALEASNKATYGSKWAIFGVSAVFGVAIVIVFYLFGAICDAIGSGFVTFVVMLALIILAASISMAVNASIWGQLKDNVA